MSFASVLTNFQRKDLRLCILSISWGAKEMRCFQFDHLSNEPIVALLAS